MFIIHSKRNRRMQCSVEFKLRFGRSRRRQYLSLVFRRSWPFGLVRSILRGVPADMDLVGRPSSHSSLSKNHITEAIIHDNRDHDESLMVQNVRFGKSSWPPHVSKFRIESSQLLLGSLQSRFQSYNSPLRPKLRVSHQHHTTLPTSLTIVRSKLVSLWP